MVAQVQVLGRGDGEPEAVGVATPRAAPVPGGASRPKPRKRRRVSAALLKQLHTWHWISAAVSLTGMFLFAITGITLNHAGSIHAEPKVVTHSATLAPALLATLAGPPPAGDAPLPAPVADKLASLVGLDPTGRPAEWSDGEVYVALPGPGSDAWISVDRASGAVTSEATDRGWISYLNDLHKGRNSGTAWFWFIDVFAAACVVFTLTGLLLLQLHARHRPSTWPLVGIGTAIPVLIAIFFLH